MCMKVEHSAAGQINLVGTPMKFSTTPAGTTHPPPLLGEHTAQVLEQLLRIDRNAFAELREACII